MSEINEFSINFINNVVNTAMDNIINKNKDNINKKTNKHNNKKFILCKNCKASITKAHMNRHINSQKCFISKCLF